MENIEPSTSAEVPDVPEEPKGAFGEADKAAQLHEAAEIRPKVAEAVQVKVEAANQSGGGSAQEAVRPAPPPVEKPMPVKAPSAVEGSAPKQPEGGWRRATPDELGTGGAKNEVLQTSGPKVDTAARIQGNLSDSLKGQLGDQYYTQLMNQELRTSGEYLNKIQAMSVEDYLRSRGVSLDQADLSKVPPEDRGIINAITREARSNPDVMKRWRSGGRVEDALRRVAGRLMQRWRTA
jgi:hypothetical protein